MAAKPTQNIHANYISPQSIKAANMLLWERKRIARDKFATKADKKTDKEAR